MTDHKFIWHDADRDMMAEARLSGLREHYTDTSAGVLQRQLNRLKKVREKLLAKQHAVESTEKSADRPNCSDPDFERGRRVLDVNISRVEAQLKAKEIETEQYRKELANVEETSRPYRSDHLSGAPLGAGSSG